MPVETKSPTIRHELLFGRRVVRCFAERPRSLWDLFLESAKADPHGDAVQWEPDGALSYDSLRRRVIALANGLAGLGLGRGDRIATLIGNRVEYVVTSLAAWRLGAILVPLDTRLQRSEIRHILDHSGAKMVLSESALADAIERNDLRDLEHVILTGEAPGTVNFQSLLSDESEPQFPALQEEDAAAILYTSGTTGVPKGVVLSHVNMVHSTMHFEAVWKLPRGSRSMLAIPGTNVTGLVTIILTMFRIGGCVVLMPPFKAADFLRIAEKRRINHTFMVPAQYKLLLLVPNFEEFDLSSWTLGSSGGAPMPATFIEELQRRIPTLQLSDGYGATELASPAIIRPPVLTRDHPDAIGLPVACADIVVVDENGVELPPGEPGELWIKGPMVCREYWRDPEATSLNFTDGYWRSGDIASRDEHGLYHLHDRKKDIVNRGGYKIYSAEVENVLAQHADVAEVAIIPKPDDVLGERVHAVLYLRTGSASVDDLRAFTAERLADYKVPEGFTILDAPLPRNSNGKIVKRTLRDQLFGGMLAA